MWRLGLDGTIHLFLVQVGICFCWPNYNRCVGNIYSMERQMYHVLL